MIKRELERLGTIKETANTTKLESPIGTPMVKLFKDDVYWMLERMQELDEHLKEEVKRNTKLQSQYLKFRNGLEETEADRDYWKSKCLLLQRQ
jgi:ribosomal protein S15P/S13E